MAKYGIFDQNGKPTAFYDDKVHKKLPAGAIRLSDSQWKTLADNQATARYINGNITTITPSLPELSVLQEQAYKTIDNLAEKQRQLYITPGDGQAMTYLLKREEAKAYQLASNPKNPIDYPLLVNEIGITGSTLDDVAQVILTKMALWEIKAKEIELARLSAKKQVSVVVNDNNRVQNIQQIIAALGWE